MNLSKFILLIVVSIIQLNVSGQTILKLENVPPNTQCDDVWAEENLNLSFVQTTSADCTVGSCFFGIEPTFVWLFPSRMTVDLSTLQNVTKVEIDVVDFCGVNCTQAFLTDTTGVNLAATGNTVISSTETLTLANPMEVPLSELAISSCEGQVHEIRIFQNIINNVRESFDSPFVSYPSLGSATDDLHFKVRDVLKWTSLERIDIFNLDGRQVYNREISVLESPDELVVPAADLPEGVFFVRFKFGEQFFTQKIIRF